MSVKITLRNIKVVVRKVLPVRPIYLENKIADKNPSKGKIKISNVIFDFEKKRRRRDSNPRREILASFQD